MRSDSENLAPAASNQIHRVTRPASCQSIDTHTFNLANVDRSSPPDTIAAAKSLLLEYGRFVQSQAAVASFCFGALEKEAADLPESYLSQGGGALLVGCPDPIPPSNVLRPVINAATQDHDRKTPVSPDLLLDQSAHRWAGFVAWRELRGEHLGHAREVKRLWVRPAARGLHLGRLLIQVVIDRAVADGKTELFLDTVPDAMQSAYRLYEAMGFVECRPYHGEGKNGIVYMRRAL